MRTKRFILSLAFVLLGAGAMFGTAHAGSEDGTKGNGENCSRSSDCLPELLCEFQGRFDEVLLSSGERVNPNNQNAISGTCSGAKQSDGDDCNLYDCNRKIGLLCNQGSEPIFGSSFGECKAKQDVGGPCGAHYNCKPEFKCDSASKKCIAGGARTAGVRTWREQCLKDTIEQGLSQDEFEECMDEDGKTCVADNECKSPLVCNTDYTNAGGILRDGRSGACKLRASVGGRCEEKGDCAEGLDCNSGNTCFDIDPTDGQGAEDPKNKNGGVDNPGTNDGGVDEAGAPLFGLQFFRNKGLGLRTDGPEAFVTGVVRTILSILALLLIVLLVYGGITYMTSAGNEKRVENGKQVITYAIVGIVIVAAAFIIAEFVIRALAG